MTADPPDLRDPALLQLAFQAAPFAMFLVDDSGSIVYANGEAERLFLYESGALLGESIEVLVPTELRDMHREHRSEYRDKPTPRRMGTNRDLVALRSDGTEFPVEIGLNPVQVDGRRHVLTAVVDLTQRVLSQEFLAAQLRDLATMRDELADLAATDELTGLRNRRAFLDQLGIQLEMCARTTRPVSILILDVDRFKEYNDDFGHLEGDEVLRRVAATLRDAARASDFVARIGGEEFAIILPETNDTGAITLGERFRQRVASAHWVKRPVTVSVGATTLNPSEPGSAEPSWHRSLLIHADRALYESKTRGRNRVCHHELPPSK